MRPPETPKPIRPRTPRRIPYIHAKTPRKPNAKIKKKPPKK